MKIISSAFKNKEKIPAKYTCDGENINPPLEFIDVPKNAQSLALICNDPDAPAGNWVHWTLWNIDPKTSDVAENSIPENAVEGITDFGRPGYGGPCPPSEVHRYFFKLYAIDIILDLQKDASAEELEKAMAGHVLKEAELIGLYSRR